MTGISEKAFVTSFFFPVCVQVSDPETPTFHILLRPKSPKTEGGCSNEIGGDQSPSAGRCDGSEACDVECKKAAALDESTTKVHSIMSCCMGDSHISFVFPWMRSSMCKVLTVSILPGRSCSVLCC